MNLEAFVVGQFHSKYKYFQVWSNDRYESVEHRVMVNSERERFSLPFLLHMGTTPWSSP